MKTHTPTKSSIHVFVVLFSVVAIVIYFALSPNHEQQQSSTLNTPASESSLPGVAVFDSAAPTPNKTPAPLIHTNPSPPKAKLSERKEFTTRDKDDPNNERSATPLQEPTKRQLEYQSLLEQKVDGYIQVTRPLLSEILRSEEFSSLTKQQRNDVAQRIVGRLNRGELRPKDVFP